MPWLNQEEIARWESGEYFNSYERRGAHPAKGGTWFTVWAPHAEHVRVFGEFNDWDPTRNPLERAGGGLWSAFVKGARPGMHYKFRIERGAYVADKTDPYSFEL